METEGELPHAKEAVRQFNFKKKQVKKKAYNAFKLKTNELDYY